VPVHDGASADGACVLAARESEHQLPHPMRRKRLRPRAGAVAALTRLRQLLLVGHFARSQVKAPAR